MPSIVDINLGNTA